MCDADQRVIAVESVFKTSGRIALSHIPGNVQRFGMCRSELSGTLETRFLPQTMTHLDLSGNKSHELSTLKSY